jgi:hypothetical protein
MWFSWLILNYNNTNKQTNKQINKLSDFGQCKTAKQGGFLKAITAFAGRMVHLPP